MSDKGGIVLLHGHGLNGASMLLIAAAARRRGFTTFAPTYRFRRPIGEIVDRLEPRVAAFADGLDGPLHVITHSLGGLVSRALLARRRPARLGRVAMLAPPHGGSEIADLLFRLRLGGLVLGGTGRHLRTVRDPAVAALFGEVDYPLGVIAGDRSILPVPARLLPRPHDGKVSVASTRLAGLTHHLIVPVPHLLMWLDRRSIGAALDFVETGRFAGRTTMGERHGKIGEP